MKKNNRAVSILGMLFIAFGLWWFISSFNGFSLFGFGRISGSGNIVTVERAIEDFDSVSLNVGDTLTIIQDGTESLTIRADDNVIDYLTSNVRGDTLVLSTDGVRTLRNSSIDYELHVEDISEIVVNGSADTYAEAITTPRLEIDVNGSGDTMIESLDAERFDLNVNGSGDTDVAGSADEQNIDINGSGSFDGSQLQGRDVDVEVNGSGNVSVLAEDELDVDINGSGDVTYGGQPRISTDINGSGSVEAASGR